MYLRILALGAGLGGLVTLFLPHFFVLGSAILGGALPLAPHRGVTHHVVGCLLAAAEQLVEKSHLASSFGSGTRFEPSQYLPRWTPKPREGKKTPKPANPRVHRLWLEEHMSVPRP